MHKLIDGIVILGLLLIGCTALPNLFSQRLSDNPNAINRAMNSTVSLVEQTEHGISPPRCTAFFVGPRLLATANHCVEIPQVQVLRVAPGLVIRLPILNAAPTIGSQVLFITYEEHLSLIRNFSLIAEPETHSATVVQVDTVEDVALLRLDDSEASANYWFPMAPTPPRLGEHVYELGMPSGQFWLFTEGMVSSIREFPSGRTVIVHQAHVSPGASGGPLFNNFGQVIGVTTSYIRDTNYIGFATPIDKVQNLIHRPSVRFGVPSIRSTPSANSSNVCENSSCPLPELE